ncbi:hypothetical protein M997_1366 [Proteus hauseri ATCC 700826]|uniref:DUF4440 domain-containing protein n=1 Tax=Proteus hauseri ATCC 700826 TaxID=1354271 RepID=A0AAJ3HTV6_PROHU|nr:DUF4440 domain-containing protein [Proteus hauseri]OAT47866.1 hypothetical protein M997_1366 [Proteus hauseri ATCC 700826]
MNLNNDAIIKSIKTLHDAIETIFTLSPLSTEALDSIKTHLSADFSMVGLSGKVVSYDEVISLFRQNAGKRSSLKIETDEYKIIYQSDCLAAVRYRETHYENKKILMRQSMVLLRRNSQNDDWQWYYLHETPITNN